MANQVHENGENSSNRNGQSGDSGGPSHTIAPKLAKLDFPPFNGSEQPAGFAEPSSSLSFKALQVRNKCHWQPIIWKGAQLWYQLLEEEEGPISWDILKVGLHARYGPTQYEDFFGDLTKLKQTGTIKEYQSQFERLLSRAGKLMPAQLVGYFISGL